MSFPPERHLVDYPTELGAFHANDGDVLPWAVPLEEDAASQLVDGVDVQARDAAVQALVESPVIPRMLSNRFDRELLDDLEAVKAVFASASRTHPTAAEKGRRAAVAGVGGPELLPQAHGPRKLGVREFALQRRQERVGAGRLENRCSDDGEGFVVRGRK